MSRAHYVLKENGGGHAGAMVRELHADEAVDIRLIRVFAELVGRIQEIETAHGRLEDEVVQLRRRVDGPAADIQPAPVESNQAPLSTPLERAERVLELLTDCWDALGNLDGDLEGDSSRRGRARMAALEHLQAYLMRAQSEANTLRDLLKAGDR